MRGAVGDRIEAVDRRLEAEGRDGGEPQAATATTMTGRPRGDTYFLASALALAAFCNRSSPMLVGTSE